MTMCACKGVTPDPFPTTTRLPSPKCQQQGKQWNGKHLHALERKYTIKGNDTRQRGSAVVWLRTRHKHKYLIKNAHKL